MGRPASYLVQVPLLGSGMEQFQGIRPWFLRINLTTVAYFRDSLRRYDFRFKGAPMLWYVQDRANRALVA